MKTLVKVLGILALSGTTAWAQGVRKDDFVRDSTGAAIPNKVVKVCASPANVGPPCTPLANIFSDITLTTPITQNDTFKTDSNGRYSFYAAPGRYFIQVLQDLVTELVRFPDVVLANDPSALAIRRASQFAGNDAGQKIAAAMNDLPATGGTVDGRALEGAQTVSSDIFNAVTKPVEIMWGAGTYTLSVNMTIPANFTMNFFNGGTWLVPLASPPGPVHVKCLGL